jgi:PPP family 3-phenylpropionic acid transporter
MRIFYAGYLLVGGVSVPFLPIWLQSRGLSPVEIADVIAIPALVRVFLTPLAGFYADHAPSRRFATISFAVPAAVIFAFAGQAESFWPILFIIGLSQTFYGLALPPAEALALTGVRNFGLDYGRMRLSGSIAFIVANLAGGAFISLFSGNPAAIFWSVAIALVGTAAVSLALPKTPPAVRAADDIARPRPQPSFAVLANVGLLALFVAAGLEQASQAMLNSFASIHWNELQFSEIQIGILWSIGIVSEVTVFLWSRRAIRRFGPYAMIAAGAIASMVRWGLFPFATHFYEACALQAFHGLTYAAVFAGAQSLIAHNVPERASASAQGVFAMAVGVLTAAVTAACGPIYQSVGVYGFFAMVPVSALGLALLPVARDRIGARD